MTLPAPWRPVPRRRDEWRARIADAPPSYRGRRYVYIRHADGTYYAESVTGYVRRFTTLADAMAHLAPYVASTLQPE